MTTADSVIYNQDCIAGMAERIPDGSIHLTVTSIPFEELFTYSGKPEDVGNNGSTIDIRRGRFALNMRFVIEQVFRVTADGCNVCIHIQQLLAYKNQHGFMGRRDFRGAIIDLFMAGGFRYTGEVAIPKDPQAMAQRLNLHSLQFKSGYFRNGNVLMPAVNDYVLIFQKPGETTHKPLPIIHKTNPTGWITTDEWIDWASGVWQIDAFDILDGARFAKEESEEKHVCPLQLEVIRRCISLYTNPISIQPDVTVLDPFMGIGSTAWIALGGPTSSGKRLAEPRNVIGFELKESYHRIAVNNTAKALTAAKVEEAAGLFDSLPEPEAVA